MSATQGLIDANSGDTVSPQKKAASQHDYSGLFSKMDDMSATVTAQKEAINKQNSIISDLEDVVVKLNAKVGELENEDTGDKRARQPGNLEVKVDELDKGLKQR
jgi:hypothetical protein